MFLSRAARARCNWNCKLVSFSNSAAAHGDEYPTKPQATCFPPIKKIMLPPGTFSGKTAFITGGGSGLGKEMTKMLSSLGANVVIGARRSSVLEETAKEISQQTGNPVLPVQMNMRQPEEIAKAFDVCEAKFGLPVIIINNSAANFVSPTERLSPNAWRTIVDTVLNGTAYVTLEAGKRLIKAKQGGVFLCITTPYTRSGSGFVSPSAAAKAGVENLTRTLSCEWGRYGIRMNCLAPGTFPTEGASRRLDPTGQFVQDFIDKVPVGRYGEVEELANLAAYMVSDYSSFVSGETFALDGGRYSFGAGEFNRLVDVKDEQWDVLEKMVRQTTEEDRKKRSKS